MIACTFREASFTRLRMYFIVPSPSIDLDFKEKLQAIAAKACEEECLISNWQFNTSNKYLTQGQLVATCRVTIYSTSSYQA